MAINQKNMEKVWQSNFLKNLGMTGEVKSVCFFNIFSKMNKKILSSNTPTHHFRFFNTL